MSTYDDDDDFGYYEEYPADCDCAYYDTDLLEGSAWCPQCGRRWWLSADDIEAEIAFQASYFECLEIQAAEDGGTNA